MAKEVWKRYDDVVHSDDTARYEEVMPEPFGVKHHGRLRDFPTYLFPDPSNLPETIELNVGKTETKIKWK